jgi:L-ascorbate 6-phosphate lactonase
MTIRFLGQSGYILKTATTTLCIDPYLSDVVEEIAGKKRLVLPPVSAEDICADAVVCSHNHLDHLDIKTVPKLIASAFYAPSDCRNVLQELGVRDYKAFDAGSSFVVGDFTIKAVYANHTVPAVGIVVEYEDKKLYFSGDTYYDEKLLKTVIFTAVNLFKSC